MAISEKGSSPALGKIKSLWLPFRISSRIASAWSVSGTLWSSSIFIRSPGIVQIARGRSISVQRAPPTRHLSGKP